MDAARVELSVNKDSPEHSQCRDEIRYRGKTLPEALVQRILAQVPFPFLFKTRGLSKSWRARLSSISAQEDEEDKNLAISFQKEIREHSVNWNMCCPVLELIGDGSPLSRAFINTFDLTSHAWLRLPLLPYLRKNLLDVDLHRVFVRDMEGPLLLFAIGWAGVKQGRCRQLYVANIFTQDCKKLPPSPHQWYNKIIERLSITSDKYQVMVFDEQDESQIVDIYDSTSAAWTSVELDSAFFGDGSSDSGWTTCVDGVLYKIVFDYGGLPTTAKLMAVNLNDETLAVDRLAEITDMSCFNVFDVHMKLSTVNLVIVIMGDVNSEDDRYREIQVVKFDLQARKLSVKAPVRLNFSLLWRLDKVVVTDSDEIFTAQNRNGDDQMLYVVAYHVRRDKLAYLPFRPRKGTGCNKSHSIFSFRPGANPFVAV